MIWRRARLKPSKPMVRVGRQAARAERGWHGKRLIAIDYEGDKGGGGRGIRTPERVTPLTVFKTAAFNGSAIPPSSIIRVSGRVLRIRPFVESKAPVSGPGRPTVSSPRHARFRPSAATSA